MVKDNMVEAYLKGIHEDMQDMKHDIKELRINETEKFQRISRVEVKINNLEDDMKTNNMKISKVEEKVNQNQMSTNRWVISLLVLIVMLLIGVIADFLTRFF